MNYSDNHTYFFVKSKEELLFHIIVNFEHFVCSLGSDGNLSQSWNTRKDSYSRQHTSLFKK